MGLPLLRLLDWLHRWIGGILGLVLALLGLSGAILAHKDAWISLPHASDTLRADMPSLIHATQTLMAAPGNTQGIIYATPRFGLHQVRFAEGAGLYADQTGHLVTRWQSQWERHELWLLDFHHHLFTGDWGDWFAGIAGIAALFFVISGAILWWRTRKTFRFRLWPKRMSRPAIVMQHRDLGIVIAPLLFLSALTGTMLLFRPVAMLVVAPFGSVTQTVKALEPPKYTSTGPLAPNPNWHAMLSEAHRRFPEAEFRILSLPRKAHDTITLRMRQPDEWLPNGRTTLWFDAATGQVLGARDARTLPPGAKLFNMAYPVHAGKVGGLIWRLVMTLSGLGMTVLGSFAVWSFWFRRPKRNFGNS